MARAALHVMNLDIVAYQQQTTPMLSHLNVGSGIDCSIKDLTETIREVVGFNGHIRWDTTKPDGAPRKLMNSDKLVNLGWRPSMNLNDGLVDAYRWYLANLSIARQ
jgi:GDP-L-fucose synthase